MALSSSENRAKRRQQLREWRRMVFQRVIAGLEALQAAGVSARVILPQGDDQPVEFLVDALDMPTMSLAARRLRRSMGNVAHYPVFTGDLTPERRATLQGSAWDLEAVQRHQRDQAA